MALACWPSDSLRKGKTAVKVAGLVRSKLGSRKMEGMSSLGGWGRGGEEGRGEVREEPGEGVVSLREGVGVVWMGIKEKEEEELGSTWRKQVMRMRE